MGIVGSKTKGRIERPFFDKLAAWNSQLLSQAAINAC
jgi:hypothetical protein